MTKKTKDETLSRKLARRAKLQRIALATYDARALDEFCEEFEQFDTRDAR